MISDMLNRSNMKGLKTLIRAFLILVLNSIFFAQAFAGNSQGNSNEKAEQQGVFLRIRPIKDLQFEAAAQGAPAETVAPSKSLYAPNAVFRIRGLPFHQVQIHLPRNSVFMKTQSKGIQRRIRVHSFHSIPSQNEPFRLGLLGFKKVFVGATRDKLHPKQAPGHYQGSFDVSVIYH